MFFGDLVALERVVLPVGPMLLVHSISAGILQAPEDDLLSSVEENFVSLKWSLNELEL